MPFLSFHHHLHFLTPAQLGEFSIDVPALLCNPAAVEITLVQNFVGATHDRTDTPLVPQPRPYLSKQSSLSIDSRSFTGFDFTGPIRDNQGNVAISSDILLRTARSRLSLM